VSVSWLNELFLRKLLFCYPAFASLSESIPMSKFKISVFVALVLAAAAGVYLYAGNAAKPSAGSANASADDKPAAAATKANSASKPSAPPLTVSTVIAAKRDYPVKLVASGTVSALNMVEIRPQVSSTITKVHIKEGQYVKKGDLLFTLDSRADEGNLARAQAQLDKDVATLADLQRQLARNQDLFDKKFISQSAVDTSLTQVQAQQAVVASDKAALNSARVALGYNRIVAPAAGRTGLINVFVGSLVQPNAAAPLVTITQIDPIAVSFPLPQRSLSDALDSMNRKDSYVLAFLPDDSKSQYKGRLQFVDNQVDAASGTIKVKAVFDNKQNKLWPGAYANVELSVRTLKDAIVVPQEAIVIGVKGSSLYVVDAESRAQSVPVIVVHSYGKEAVVSGVEAGAKIVVEGKQNVRPGSLVKERAPENKEKPAQNNPVKAESTEKAEQRKLAPASTPAPDSASKAASAS
jgi:RND family efflux transporter MFP subunit